MVPAVRRAADPSPLPLTAWPDELLGPVVIADDPCMETLWDPGPGFGIKAYTAREWDPETGLYYYRARYYDPKIGRFISEDPIGFDGGENFYSYVLNDPVNLSDPFGLDVDVCFYPDAAYGYGHVGFGLPGETGTSGYYSDGIRPDEQKDKQCKKIESPPDKDDCMLKCREERKANPGKYKLMSRQCTSFVRDCLAQCGLPAGTYTGPKPRPFFEDLPPKSKNGPSKPKETCSHCSTQ